MIGRQGHDIYRYKRLEVRRKLDIAAAIVVTSPVVFAPFFAIAISRASHSGDGTSMVFAAGLALVVGLAQMFLPCGSNASVGVSYAFGGYPPTRVDVVLRIAILTASALASSAISGILLGIAGRVLLPRSVIGLPLLVPTACLFFGLLALLPIRHSLPQRDRETPPPWTVSKPYTWALIDGSALGLGWMTRIQYAVWYVIPLAAIASGSPILGGLIFLSYGFGRMWGTWSIPVVQASGWWSAEDLSVRLLAWIPRANSVCALMSLVTGSALLVLEVAR